MHPLKTVVSTTILSFFVLTTIAQTKMKDSIRNITLKAQVTDAAGVTGKSYLHSVSDSGMFLMRMKQPVHSTVDPKTLTFMNVDQIKLVKIRKKNQIASGLAVGVLVGAILGGAIGVASHQSGPPGSWDFGAGVDGILGAGAGMLVGGIIGVGFSISSRKYRVNGDAYNYMKMQQKINTRIKRNKVRT